MLGYVESFNGKMRDELLNETLFYSLDHARTQLPNGSPTTTPPGRIQRWRIKHRQPLLPNSPQQDFTLRSRMAPRSGLLLKPPNRANIMLCPLITGSF